MEKIKVPARAIPVVGYRIKVPKQLIGTNFKVLIREKAKKNPLYHIPIEFEEGIEVSGRTDSGEEIPINTLGRWIFGTPGYAGNAIFNIFEGVIQLPKKAPQEAIRLIEESLKEVEKDLNLHNNNGRKSSNWELDR